MIDHIKNIRDVQATIQRILHDTANAILELSDVIDTEIAEIEKESALTSQPIPTGEVAVGKDRTKTSAYSDKKFHAIEG